MNQIPILWQHNPEYKIGSLDPATGIMTFQPRTVTADMIFNCGFRVLDQEMHEGVRYITRAQLIEVSVG